MKTIKILYWVFTILLVALMLFSAYGTFRNDPQGAEMAKHIGYPLYIFKFLAVAKILGVIAILVPGFPRLKEWAYAGLFFDLIGASFSIIAVGNISGASFMVLPIALGITSYVLYTKRRRLQQQHAEITNRTAAAFANAA